MESTPLNNQLSQMSSKSYEEYKEWLDRSIKNNRLTTISLFEHVHQFLFLHKTVLGYARFFYLEKEFECCLELRLLDYAKAILIEIKNEFGKEPKVRRLEAQFLESSNDPDYLEKAIIVYRNLIQNNIEDRTSIKRYIMMTKISMDTDNLKKTIDLWNEYLKVYMDDVDAWHELSDIYIQAGNILRAIYCLEEVILHHPNNVKYYIKIGDLYCNFNNNADAATNAIKYYSQSILFKPTPRAFWGLLYAINIIWKTKKSLDDKLKNLVKISNINLKNMYKNTPFKFNIEDVLDIKLD